MISYEIMLNGCMVGTADVETEGLYLKIQARCNPPDMQIYRLILFCDSRKIDLGICVPENNYFVIKKRIRQKLIGEGTPEFLLETTLNSKSTQYIVLDPEKPFDYLDRLQSAYFEKRDATCGVVLR